MPDALDTLFQRGGSTEPDAAFRAELMARVRAALNDEAAAEASGAHVEVDDESADSVPGHGQRRDRHRRAWVVRSAALVIVVAALAAIVWSRSWTRPDQAPADVPPSVPTTVSDRTFAPLSGVVFGVTDDGSGPVLDRRQFSVTDHGVTVSPSSPQPITHAVADERYVDLYVGDSSVTTVTCCDRGVGTVWRDDQRVGRGTRFDNSIPTSGAPAWVDPTSGTVVIGALEVDEPGAVDVAVIDDTLTAALVGGETPRLVLYESTNHFTEPAFERRELPAPSGACAIVTVDGGVVVFSGHADGDDPCIAGHGTELELGAGQIVTEFDLPAPLRNVDSDHHQLITGTTPGGTVWIGTLNPRPAWYRLIPGDYEVADIWAQS